MTMKIKSLVATAVIASLGLSSVAQAAGQWSLQQQVEEGRMTPDGEARMQRNNDIRQQRQAERDWRNQEGGQFTPEQRRAERHRQGDYSQGYYRDGDQQRYYRDGDQQRYYRDRDQQRYYGGQQYYGRHYARGGYVPRQYLEQRYWVNDWRARRLQPPPYGYQWVQSDTGDILLVALATGLIANVLLTQ